MARHLSIMAIVVVLIDGGVLHADVTGSDWHRFEHALGQPAWS